MFLMSLLGGIGWPARILILLAFLTAFGGYSYLKGYQHAENGYQAAIAENLAAEHELDVKAAKAQNDKNVAFSSKLALARVEAGKLRSELSSALSAKPSPVSCDDSEEVHNALNKIIAGKSIGEKK